MNEPKSKIKLYSNYFDDKLDKNMPDQLLQEIPVNLVTKGNVTSFELLRPMTIEKGYYWFEIPISVVEPKSELILRRDEPKPEEIKSIDEFEHKYLPNYTKEFPIRMRVTKVEQDFLLNQRGGYRAKAQ